MAFSARLNAPVQQPPTADVLPALQLHPTQVDILARGLKLLPIPLCRPPGARKGQGAEGGALVLFIRGGGI